MPPKKRPPPPPPSPPSPSTTTPTTTAIHEAFTLFAPAPSSLLPTISLPRALTALNAAPTSAEKKDIVEAADPAGTGWVEFENFEAVAMLLLEKRGLVDTAHVVEDGRAGARGQGVGRGKGKGKGREEARRGEVEEAFKLFLNMGGGRGGRITVETLRRVAGVLKEDVSEGVLRDMLAEAEGEEGEVGLQGFEGVMRRAGVWG